MGSKKIVRLIPNVKSPQEKRYIGCNVMDASFGFICTVLVSNLNKYPKTKILSVKHANPIVKIKGKRGQMINISVSTFSMHYLFLFLFKCPHTRIKVFSYVMWST